MAYTVKFLSRLSKVSIRTLHYYEEIGLLQPAYYGSNGYRYYEEKELLELQQILFFKTLGFSLKQIQSLLKKDNFNQLDALFSHRKSLEKQKENLEKLLKTVSQTIKHLQGEIKMKEHEFFEGFHLSTFKKGSPKDSTFESEEIVIKSVINPTQSKEDVQKRGQAFYEAIYQEAHALFLELKACMQSNEPPSSEKVQAIIQRHSIHTQKIHHLSKEMYLALAHLYKEHPGFKKELEAVDPRLPAYMSEAMSLFANENL